MAAKTLQTKVLMAAISMILVACTSPASKAYSIPFPMAQSGTQHILLGQAIDVNTADAATLEALPGVGPSLAQAIVADRAQHGPFRSVADLNRVHRIGAKLLTKLAPFVSVSSKE